MASEESDDPWERLSEDEEMLEAMYSAEADERFKCPICQSPPIRTGPVDDLHMYAMCLMGHIITRHFEEVEEDDAWS